MPFRVHSHGASDVGLVRTNNEDAWFASPDGRLFLIADGLGGHQAGEVAAREAIDLFLSCFLAAFPDAKDPPGPSDEILHKLQTCFETTNARIFVLSGQHELLRGMGTTFCSLSFHGECAAVAHVGDSRIYRHRDGVLEQLTKDHCWVSREGGVPEVVGQKGMLTKALGTMPTIDPTIQIVPLRSRDTFLLCTDGLSDMLSHDEIESILNRDITIGERVRMLIAESKQKGGADNVTAILVEVLT